MNLGKSLFIISIIFLPLHLMSGEKKQSDLSLLHSIITEQTPTSLKQKEIASAERILAKTESTKPFTAEERAFAEMQLAINDLLLTGLPGTASRDGEAIGKMKDSLTYMLTTNLVTSSRAPVIQRRLKGTLPNFSAAPRPRRLSSSVSSDSKLSNPSTSSTSTTKSSNLPIEDTLWWL